MSELKEVPMISVPFAEYILLQEGLLDAYRMLRDSLDTNLMLANKLTNAQARWLGKTNAD